MAVEFKSDIDLNGRALTNATFDANGGSNSLSNVEVADFTAASIVTESEGLDSSDNDTSLPTTAAVKAYADNLLAANDAMTYKGATDCSGNPNYPTAKAGDTYKVSVAGKIGGASGEVVEIGDMYICTSDSGWITAIGSTTDNTNGTLSDGTWTNGGAGYASTSDGSGTGATFDVSITGGVPTLVLNSEGTGYAGSDTIVVAESTDFSTVDTGTLNSSVSTVSDNSGTQAAVGAKWNVIQVNIDGAVTGPASATDNAIAVYDGTTGDLIKNSLSTVDTSGSINIPTGQAYEINSVDILTASTINSSVTSAAGLTTVGTLATGNATAIVDAASTTAAGISELATSTETEAKSSSVLAVPPSGLTNFMLKYSADVSTSTGSTITGVTHGITTVLNVVVLEDDGTNYVPTYCTISWNKSTMDVTWSIDTSAINARIVIYGV